MESVDTKTSPHLRIGREIRAWWIGRENLTQAQLGKLLGIAQPQVSKRLNGKQPFGIDELITIAVELDITLGQLLGDELVNEKNPHLMSGEGSRGRNAGQLVAGDGFEPSTSGL